ncbi:hypothetical protein [Streptomyces sp. NPDC001978]|uniref:hypothetical protein n=1 Tax=Streptomyces sp. NPDC001978 TaxID=3364627 RepID=UPI00367651C7
MSDSLRMTFLNFIFAFLAFQVVVTVLEGSWSPRVGGGGLLVAAIVTAFARWQQAKSGWDEWYRTAKTLPWRDRWQLYRATARGRAVSDPRLAPLAVQRADRLSALLKVGQRLNPRWLQVGSTVLFLVIGSVLLLRREWVLGGISFVLALMSAFTSALHQRGVRRAQRCIEANRRLVNLK